MGTERHSAPSSRRRWRARTCEPPWWPAACVGPCRRWTCCSGGTRGREGVRHGAAGCDAAGEARRRAAQRTEQSAWCAPCGRVRSAASVWALGADVAACRAVGPLSDTHARGARAPVAGAHARTHVAVTSVAVSNTRAHECQGAQGPHRARDALRRRPARVQAAAHLDFLTFFSSCPAALHNERQSEGGCASAGA